VNAPNFPEGFRTGYELRGFKAGNARFPLSPAEHQVIAAMRGKLACLLGDCGFSEAAAECRMDSTRATGPASVPADVSRIVNEVMHRLKQHGI
jgi:hypothetical protein